MKNIHFTKKSIVFLSSLVFLFLVSIKPVDAATECENAGGTCHRLTGNITCETLDQLGKVNKVSSLLSCGGDTCCMPAKSQSSVADPGNSQYQYVECHTGDMLTDGEPCLTDTGKVGTCEGMRGCAASDSSISNSKIMCYGKSDGADCSILQSNNSSLRGKCYSGTCIADSAGAATNSPACDGTSATNFKSCTTSDGKSGQCNMAGQCVNTSGGTTSCSQCDNAGNPLACYKDCAGASGCSQCDNAGSPLACYKDCANTPSSANTEKNTAAAGTETAGTVSTAKTSTKSSCQSKCAAGDTTCFQNPLDFCSLEDFLMNFLSVLQKIIVLLALIFIIIGALMIVTSAGTGQMEKGKKAITMALVGLAVGIGAPSILKELTNILGWSETGNAAVDEGLGFVDIAFNVLNFLMGIFGLLSLVMMVIGGMMFVTSAGDTGRVDTGKKIFKYAVIGIIVAMSAMMVITQIGSFFR